jgi:MFS family permease
LIFKMVGKTYKLMTNNSTTSNNSNKILGINHNLVFLINEILLDSCFKFLVFYSLFFASSGMSLGQIAILEMIEKTSSLLFEIPAGILADYLDQKTVLNLGFIGMIAAILVFIFNRSFESFIVAEIVWGVGSSCVSGTNVSWLSSRTSESNANHVSSRITRYTGLTAVVAGFLGGIISNYLGFSWAWGVLVVVIGFLVIFNVLYMQNDSIAARPSWQSELAKIKSKLEYYKNIFQGLFSRQKNSDRVAETDNSVVKVGSNSTYKYLKNNLSNNIAIAVNFLLGGATFLPIFVFWQILVSNNFGWNLTIVGLVSGIIYIFVSAGGFLFGRFVNLGMSNNDIQNWYCGILLMSSIIIGITANSAFFGLNAALGSVIFVIGMLGIEIALGLFFSNKNYLINKDLDDEFRTATLSMFNFFRSGGMILGFWIFGLVVDSFGLNIAFLTPILFSFLMVVGWNFRTKF